MLNDELEEQRKFGQGARGWNQELIVKRSTYDSPSNLRLMATFSKVARLVSYCARSTRVFRDRALRKHLLTPYTFL